jgi:hypothetical protein
VEDNAMIPQSKEVSPGQKAAIENAVSRRLQNQGNTVASLAARQQAAELMRHQLFLLDPSERRMSIEDYAAVLLEQSDLMS